MVDVGVRDELRTDYPGVLEAMDAIRLHDSRARDVVVAFTSELVTHPGYQRAYQIEVGWSFLDAMIAGHLRVWTTPSLLYVGIGGRRWFQGPAADNDGFELVGQVFTSRLVVHSVLLADPTELVPAREVDFLALPPLVCPRCQQTLPVSGVCGWCD